MEEDKKDAVSGSDVAMEQVGKDKEMNKGSERYFGRNVVAWVWLSKEVSTFFIVWIRRMA